MNMFQIILLVFLGTLGVAVLVFGARRSIGRPIAVVMLVVLAIGMLATLDPDRMTVIARTLGISRGSDLILYVMTLVVLQGFFIFYLRLRKVRRELTLLVRRLAIMEAPGSNPRSNPTPHLEQEDGRTSTGVPPEQA